MRKIAAAIFLIFIYSSCAVQTDVDRQVNTASNTEKIAAIKKLAKHGDWFAVRGTHETDNLVSTLTNMPLSHAAIYDAENSGVIEADGTGIHTNTIETFVAKSRRILIIRPIWATSEQATKDAVIRAREAVGKKYDYLGLIGLNVKDRYYCTELAVSAYQPKEHSTKNPIPPVIAPGQLYHWGTIIYDSGPEVEIKPAPLTSAAPK
jgi:uncharacterized protein YycO